MSTLLLFSFSKRSNSTAAPADSSGASFDVVLKDRTSILNPVFLLSLDSFPQYNYAKYLGRYYFINNVESVHNNLWALSCSVDVLATYKAAIQASSAFVLFDTAANTELTDGRISIKTSQVTQVNSANFVNIGTDVSAVVSIVGNSNTTTFQMSVNDAANLMNGLDTWLNTAIARPAGGSTSPEEAIDALSDMATDAFRQLVATGSAKDCIKSATIVPVPLSALWAASVNVWLGDFNTGRSHKRIPNTKNRILKDIINVQIPWQATDWRRNSPYHELYIYIPYIGLNRLPVGDLIGETSISIEASIDVATGDTIFRLYTATKTIAQYTAQLGIAFPIGSSNVTPLQVANTILSAGQSVAGAAGSFLSGNIGGGIAGSLGTIQGIMNNLEPLPSCVGGNSGGASLGLANTVYCISVFHDTNVTPDSVSAIMGTPAREVKSLGSLSGYVQTVGASVAGFMTGGEREQINQLLNGGIYIE